MKGAKEVIDYAAVIALYVVVNFVYPEFSVGVTR